MSGGRVMYVSTGLATWFPTEPYGFGRDVTIEHITYRRLDPGYYAWLRHKMELAKNAMNSGWLTSEAYDALHDRFGSVHAWAVANLGRDELRCAVRDLEPGRYRAPADETPRTKQKLTLTTQIAPADESSAEPHLFPADGTWPFTQPVLAAALAQIDAISATARAQGWSLAALYQNRSDHRFPSGQQYGVVCFLSEGTTILEVTPHAIALGERDGTTGRIYNPDAVNAWCHKPHSPDEPS